MKLLDDEGNEVPDGEEGAICVTGLKEAYPPGLFVGYYQDEERTREACLLYTSWACRWRARRCRKRSSGGKMGAFPPLWVGGASILCNDTYGPLGKRECGDVSCRRRDAACGSRRGGCARDAQASRPVRRDEKGATWLE